MRFSQITALFFGNSLYGNTKPQLLKKAQKPQKMLKKSKIKNLCFSYRLSTRYNCGLVERKHDFWACK